MYKRDRFKRQRPFNRVLVATQATPQFLAIRGGFGNVAIAAGGCVLRIAVTPDAGLRHQFERLVPDGDRLADCLPVDMAQFARVDLWLGGVLHA